MDRRRFNHLGQALARRGLLRSLTALPLGIALTSWRDVAAARRRGRLHAQRKNTKKHKKCAKAGQKPKQGKRCCQKLVKDGSGRCAAACIPATCTPNACGSLPDGCGGTLSCGGCAGNTVCVAGACQLCDVCDSGCPFSTVQAAIDAADAGQTIRLCAGTYHEDLTLDQSLTLTGAGDGNGGGSTILQGTGTTSVVTIAGGGTTVNLQRLRITGGAGGGSFGGGITNGGNLTLSDCTVSGNTATIEGGGISNGGNLTLTGCTITGNSADNRGGGIFNGFSFTLELINSTISGNMAAGRGGGIYNYFGTVTLDAGSQVTGNETEGGPITGGGIYNENGTVTLSSAANVTGNTPNNCAPSGTVPLCAG